MWVADFNEDKQLGNKKRVEFKAGDWLLLPYGTVHAGDINILWYFQNLHQFFSSVYRNRVILSYG